MKSINQCLNAKLIDICLTSFQVDKINDAFQQLLPEHLRGLCRVSSFVKGKLSITVSDPIYATELKYLLPEIRDGLRREYHLYQLIQCEVIQDIQTMQTQNKGAKTQKTASPQATEAITSLAQQLEYPPLKEAVSRWADHLAPRRY